jgi:uncharacterized LabA/DUF88 family protein
MGFVIVVDGPNFLNDMKNHGKDNDYVMNVLSFPLLQNVVQAELNQHGLSGHPFIHTYFVCSARKRIANFTKAEERDALIEKLKKERGVTVDEIVQSRKNGDREQEVDMNVFIRMLEMGPFARPHYDFWRHIVLMSRDKDYVPAIRMLSQMGIHTIVVGFDSKEHPYPIELKNESYLFLELGDLLRKMEKQQTH